MKYITIIVLGLFLTVTNFADNPKKFGSEISLKEKSKISTILEKPEDFVGKKVLVEGTVLNVCKKRGCWIELAGDKEFETIRVKVNDGEIVFPMEIKGKNAVVEGEVYAINLEAEHKCDHKEGESCDADDHEKETKTIYQLKGIGAVVK